MSSGAKLLINISIIVAHLLGVVLVATTHLEVLLLTVLAIGAMAVTTFCRT